MKFKALMLGALAITGIATANHETGDYKEIQEFSAAQRKEISHLGKGELMIGGDVRVEMKHLYEKYNDSRYYGSESYTGAVADHKANVQWDVEVDLVLDHKTEKTWAHAQLEFDNNMGTGEKTVRSAVEDVQGSSGTSNSIKLEQAYFGICLMEEGSSKLDLEVGRNNGDNRFDSKIQFNNVMDGAFLKYSNGFEGIGDGYVKVGSFLVNEINDQYATVGELGLMDIANTGVYAKYSFIDWSKADIKDFRYHNSQFTVGTVITPEAIGQDVHLYAAYLRNHAAKKDNGFDHKYNNAWYTGVSIGNVEKAGDWFVNVDYQYVGAYSVMDSDVSGIGMKHAANTGEFIYGDNHRGNANYKGYEISALYAVTDSLSINAEWQDARTAKRELDGGKKQIFRKFELEGIYSF